MSIFLMVMALLFLSLWIMTGKWLKKGEKPTANGKNKYAIVLGAKVNGETPTLSLQYRVEAALAYAHQYPNVTFILSGGQGQGEDITEAEAMKRLFVEEGIKTKRLLLETRSTSTYENIKLSKEMLPKNIQSITIITSDYHLQRTKILARNLGLETDVVIAQTPKKVELKLQIRERLALIQTVLGSRGRK